MSSCHQLLGYSQQHASASTLRSARRTPVYKKKHTCSSEIRLSNEHGPKNTPALLYFKPLASRSLLNRVNLNSSPLVELLIGVQTFTGEYSVRPWYLGSHCVQRKKARARLNSILQSDMLFGMRASCFTRSQPISNSSMSSKYKGAMVRVFSVALIDSQFSFTSRADSTSTSAKTWG